MRNFLSYLLVWSVECIPQKYGTAMRHNASVSKTPSRTFYSATQTVIKANAAAHRLLKPFAIRSFAQQWEFIVRALGHFHRIIIFFLCPNRDHKYVAGTWGSLSHLCRCTRGGKHQPPATPFHCIFVAGSWVYVYVACTLNYVLIRI